MALQPTWVLPASLHWGIGEHEVLEDHHPRDTTLPEALQGNLLLRDLCRGLSGGHLRGVAGFYQGSTGFLGGLFQW